MSAEKHVSEIRKSIGILILTVIVSILSGFLPDWIDKWLKQAPSWKVPEQVILALCIFIALTMIEIVWLLSRDLDVKLTAQQVIHLDSIIDRMLHNIRASHHELAIRSNQGDKDFFVAYFHDAMRLLEARVRDAAKKGEICCEGEHVNLKESLVGTLLSSATLKLRYSWRIGKNDPLFDFFPWLSYFKTTCELAVKGKIKSLEVLLIFEADEVKNRPDVKALIELYSKLDHTACYTLDLQKFNQVVDSVHPQQKCFDFGMYGENLLYLGLDYGPVIHKAVFTSDGKAIQDYDKIWRACLSDAEVVPKGEKFRGKIIDMNSLMSAADKQQQLKS